MKHGKLNRANDPAQIEFAGILWLTKATPPHRLRAGDVIRFNHRLGRVLRVNDCAAVILMNRPVREFKTRFDNPVRFAQSPTLFRISPNSEAPILNRKTPGPPPR